MRYEVIVDLEFASHLDHVNAPESVRAAVDKAIAALDGCEDPLEFVVPQLGGGHKLVVEVWEGEFLHRAAVRVEVQPDTGICWILDVLLNAV